MSYQTGVCNFCGTGCGHFLDAAEDAIRGVFPAPAHPVSRGRLCLRGWHIHELLASEERIDRPLVRGDGILRESTWEEALGLAADRLAGFAGDEIGFLASPRSSNESLFALVRMARSVFRSPNISLLSSEGHRAAADVLQDGLGWPAMTGSLADIRPADFILIVGGDLTRQNPIIAGEIHLAARGGADVVTLGPRKTQMAKLSGSHLWSRPGSERIVLAAMSRILIEEDRIDAGAAGVRAEGFEAFRARLADVRLDEVEAASGIPLETIRGTVRRLAASPRVHIFFPSGQIGLDRETIALLFNLALAADKIGRPGCGFNPLTGICNIAGAMDMGASPDRLPGWRRLPADAPGASLEKIWPAGVDVRRGRSVPELLAESPSPLKALIAVDHDEEIILQAERIRALDLVVSISSTRNPFMDLAHIVLPSATHAEADGTYTNTERRIQLNRRKTAPRFEARPEWRIFADLAARRGQTWPYRSAKDVFTEISEAVPAYAAVTYEKLEKRFGGLQWPCDSARPDGTPRFEAGNASAIRYAPLGRTFSHPPIASPDFPLLFTAGSASHYWHQNSAMKKTFIPRREYNALLLLYPQGLVEIHPDDAARLGVRDRRPIRVVSAAASMEVAARVTEDIRPGAVHAPYFIGRMVPDFLRPHAALFELGEDVPLAVRIEKA
jgi:predicted molibdopterin-dependent oxidoreductase YjgC